MDVSDAVECAHLIKCNTVVGVHYDTYGFIKIDHDEARNIFSKKERELHLIKIGETIDI